MTNDSYRNDPAHDGHDAYSGRRSRDSFRGGFLKDLSETRDYAMVI